MAVVKNLMVRAGADFSAITKQSNKAKASMKGMQTSVSKSCSLMTSAASGMKKAFAAMGAVLSVSAVVSFGKEAKAAYDEQAEASAKLAQVMRNTMGVRADEVKSIEDFIDAQERLGVVTGDIQTEGAQELATYLTLSSSLKTLIPVMNDMVAQQYGLSASAESAVSIATMLGKVMNGQTSALSRYGYSFTAAQEAVLKYGTEAERAAVLAEVVSESVGGMNAALAATPNGRLKQVSNTLGKIQETFGQAINHVLVLFIPALNVLCSMLANVATLANKLAQTLANVFGSGASKAATTVSYTGAVSEAVSELEAAAESAGEAMGALGFDQMTKLPTSSEAAESESAGGPVGRIAESVDGTEEAGESIGWLEARLTALQEKFASFDTSKLTGGLARLKEAAAPLTQGLFSGLSWVMDNVLVPLAGWTVESGLPAFLAGLAAAGEVLSGALERMQPFGSWLWNNFLQPIAGWAGDAFIDAMKDLEDSLSNLSDLISGEISFRDFIAELGPLEQACLGVAAAMSALTVATKGVTAIAAISAAIKSIKVGPIGKLVEVFMLASQGAGTLSEAMVAVFGKTTSIFAGIGAIVGGAVTAISSFLTMLKNGFSWAQEALMALGVAIAAVGAVILGAPAAVAAAVAAIVATVATLVVVIKDNWESIKTFFAELWKDIKSIFQGFADFFAGVFSGDIDRAMKGISGIFSGLKTVVSSVLDAASNILTGFFDSLEGLFKGRLPITVALLKETLLAAVSWIKETLGGLFDAWKQIFSGIITFFSGVFSGNWSKAWAGIVQVGKGSINVLVTAVESFVNFFVKALNAVIDAVNKLSIKVPKWVPGIGGESFGFNIPKIPQLSLPRLASGTVAQPGREFAAILGDNTREPEIVSPVSTMQKAFMDVLKMLGATGKNNPNPTKIVIPVYVGGRKITEKVIEDINDLTRTTGECPIMI